MQNYLTKTNIIIAIVVLALIVGGLVYFGFKGNAPTANNVGGSGSFPESPGKTSGGETTNPSVPSAPGAGNVQTPASLPLGTDQAKNLPIGTLIRLSNNVVASLITKSDGNVRYHKNITESLGHLFERKADGTDNERKISNFTIPQILKVVWAPDATKAVIFYKLETGIRKLLVDYKSTSTPKTNFLPDSVSDVAFSPDSKSLAFINDLDTTRNIFISTSDFKNQKKVANNVLPNLELSWPSASFLAVKTRSSYAANGYLYTVNIKTGAMSKIVEGLGLDAIWNPDATGVLYSTVNSGGQMNTIKFFDIKTQTSKDLGARTIAEKCAFLKTSKNVAYCGVPEQIPPGHYPDDWWKGKISFKDDFVVLDILNNKYFTFVTTPSDITKPMPTPNDSAILFVDKITSLLWSLKLK